MSSSSKAQIHVIVYAKAVTFYVRHKTAKTLQTPFFTILLRGKEQFPKVNLRSLFCLNTRACFVLSRSRYNRISTEKLSIRKRNSSNSLQMYLLEDQMIIVMPMQFLLQFFNCKLHISSLRHFLAKLRCQYFFLLSYSIFIWLFESQHPKSAMTVY